MTSRIWEPDPSPKITTWPKTTEPPKNEPQIPNWEIPLTPKKKMLANDFSIDQIFWNKIFNFKHILPPYTTTQISNLEKYEHGGSSKLKKERERHYGWRTKKISTWNRPLHSFSNEQANRMPNWPLKLCWRRDEATLLLPSNWWEDWSEGDTWKVKYWAEESDLKYTVFFFSSES